MKCKVGDRVRFLNDVGGGKVTRIQKDTVYVLGDDGFEVPVLQAEVIVVDDSKDSGFNQNSDRKDEFLRSKKEDSNLSTSKPEISIDSIINEIDLTELNFASDLEDEKDEDGDMIGLFLAFVPKNQAKIDDSDHDLYIINDSPYRLFYSISRWEGEFVLPLRTGFLYPDTKELVYDFKKDELNNSLVINIQSLFFKNTKYTPQQPEFYDLKINPTKFYRTGSFIENDFFDEKALIFSVADTRKEELIRSLTSKAIESSIKEKDLTRNKPEVKKEIEVEEVDLHIEELVENPKEYSAGQILEIQMSRFTVALQGAINRRKKRIVFIHGVGNGKLKHEILKELGRKYPKLRYQDASFKEYGYGATIVFLK